MPGLTTLPGWDPSWVRFASGTEVAWSLNFWTGEYDGELETANDSGTLTW